VIIVNLQIDNLRTFIAVADTKGVTKAGLRLNGSQSAVSMQIKRLLPPGCAGGDAPRKQRSKTIECFALRLI
jgi:hypothetical protein